MAERDHVLQKYDGGVPNPDSPILPYELEMVRGVVINTKGELLVMQKGPFSKTAWQWEFTGGSTIGTMPAKPVKLVRELIREMREETTLIPRPDQIILIINLLNIIVLIRGQLLEA